MKARTLASLAVLFITMGSTPAPAEEPGAPPRGLFVCRGPNATPQRDVDFPFVDGWLVRPGWERVEPREGEFDFSFIDAELDLARRLHKKITLAVLGGPQAPAWLYRAGAQGFTFRMPFGRRSEAKIPVPWDETYLAKWKALIAALGRRYGREPAVVLVHMTGATGNGLEMQLPFMPEDRQQWDQRGYRPDKLIAAWRETIDAFAVAFPGNPLDIDVHPVLGSDEVARQVAAYGSQKLGRRFGIYGGWLSGKPAADDPHHAGMQAIAAQYGPKGFAAFQMIASQTPNRANPRFSNLFAEGGLKAAVQQGLLWNAHYFEIWETDVTNPQLAPLLGDLAARLRRP